MAKYVAYIDIKDKPMSVAEKYLEDVKKSINESLMEPGDKLLVLAIRGGNTRIEVLPNV